jgi:hypothetical protein
MTKEERISRALISRDRCLNEIPKVTNVDDKASLWKAALKFNGLAREIRASAAGLESAGSPRLALGGLGMGQER